MELKRVVVTGLGAVSPIGNTAEETWQNMLAGVSGAAPITKFNAEKFKTQFACEVKNFDANKYIDRKEARKMDAYCHYALAAAQMAVETTKALSEVEFDGTSLKKTFATGVSSMVNGLSGELNTGSINLNVPRLPSLATNAGNVTNTTVINNTYEMNQNNYSPKAINALQAYQYQKQEMAMIKAATRKG